MAKDQICVSFLHKSIPLFLYCIFISFSSYAQSRAATVLWEVSRQGSPYKSYLLGTFHEVNPTFFDRIPQAREKLKNAQVLLVEQTTGDRPTNGKVSTAWNHAKWNEVLVPEQKEIFEKFVSKSEDSIWYNVHPLVLNLALFRIYAQNFCDTLDRSSNELMDTYIEKIAVENHIETKSLDGDLGAVLSKSSQQAHARLADLSSNCVDLMDKMLRDDASGCTFLNDYKNFNLDYQFDLQIKQLPLPPAFLADRNAEWMKTLDTQFRSKNCFVAVGLRHLFYREGLIQELKALGYSVAPVLR